MALKTHLKRDSMKLIPAKKGFKAEMSSGRLFIAPTTARKEEYAESRWPDVDP